MAEQREVSLAEAVGRVVMAAAGLEQQLAHTVASLTQSPLSLIVSAGHRSIASVADLAEGVGGEVLLGGCSLPVRRFLELTTRVLASAPRASAATCPDVSRATERLPRAVGFLPDTQPNGGIANRSDLTLIAGAATSVSHGVAMRADGLPSHPGSSRSDTAPSSIKARGGTLVCYPTVRQPLIRTTPAPKAWGPR